jgi:tRNA(His) 5'-end guanylyltransferase
MSIDSTDLGDRMKSYEAATRYVLPRRTYAVIRVDGRAFHSYLRGADKPFDFRFMADMANVAGALCEEIGGAMFAYLQSDEISVLVTDFGSTHTEPWFGGVVQKMASIAAATATACLCAQRSGLPVFDGRVFTIPSAVEVANYFLWRQRDAVRNSVSMAAQAHFSHKSLHGMNGAQMQERLWQEKGVNWNDYPGHAKRGSVCTRYTVEEDVTYTDKRSGEEVTTPAVRSRWVVEPAPHFVAEPGTWLADHIPSLPSLDLPQVVVAAGAA